MWWRQLDAVRLARARRERRHRPPAAFVAAAEKETLATCQYFNAEVCYGSGLQYCATEASASVYSAVEDFTLDNEIAAYFLGICQDFKHFDFAVSVLILNEDGTKIMRLLRKEACYSRFTQFIQIFVLGEFSSMVNDAERL